MNLKGEKSRNSTIQKQKQPRNVKLEKKKNHWGVAIIRKNIKYLQKDFKKEKGFSRKHMIEDPRCSNVTIKHFCTRLLSDLTAMEKTPFGENTGRFELQHFFYCKLLCAAVLFAIKMINSNQKD